jgi:hypothetical protein
MGSKSPVAERAGSEESTIENGVVPAEVGTKKERNRNLSGTYYS